MTSGAASIKTFRFEHSVESQGYHLKHETSDKSFRAYPPLPFMVAGRRAEKGKMQKAAPSTPLRLVFRLLSRVHRFTQYLLHLAFIN